MAKRRPIKYVTGLSPRGLSSLRARWRSWMDGIVGDLDKLLVKKKVFEELMAIVNANAVTRDPRTFLEWLVDNYIVAVTIGIRRITDEDSRSHSLGRILVEMVTHPRIMSRRAHQSLYRDSAADPNETFDRIAGRRRSFVSRQVLRRDLKMLRQAEERVRKYVNKRIAHTARPGAIRRLPTFGELHNVLSVLDRIAVRYNLLLTAEAIGTSRSILFHDWRKVLRTAWWPQEQKAKAS
jgi:AbiU2